MPTTLVLDAARRDASNGHRTSDALLEALRIAGYSLEGEPERSDEAWFIAYDSTRMDLPYFYVVPVTALDQLLCDAVDTCDRRDLREADAAVRAAGLRLALAFGAASLDDVEVENLELPVELQIGAAEFKRSEELFCFALGQPREGTLLLEKMSTHIIRIAEVTDR